MNPGRVVIDRRPWCDAGRAAEHYRLRFQHDHRSAPPRQGGTRTTDGLTPRARGQLCEAVEWCHATRRPMTTFLTLTFDAETRERLANGPGAMKYETADGALASEWPRRDGTTIQAELARWFDAVNVARRRGFRADARYRTEDGAMASEWPRRKVRFEPAAEEPKPMRGDEGPASAYPRAVGPLRYLWVAEAPTGDDGTPNPHVHVLMRWRTSRDRFASWAGHLEHLWGRGFAHLEKIREPRAAGDYLLKALGYLSKAGAAGEGSDQGVIHGNRYGISSTARAPAWEHAWTRELDVMPAVMRAAYRFQREAAAPIRGERDHLKRQRAATPAHHKARRQRLTRRIDAMRRKLRERPIIAGKYTVRTRSADDLRTFLLWAGGRSAPPPSAGLPARRPPSPYRGGPRPRSVAATLTAEHGAGLRRIRRSREQHEHEWRARLALAETIPDELHDAPHPALPIEPPPGLLDYLHGALAA